MSGRENQMNGGPEKKIIGIDFGTTYSVVAFVEQNEPVVVPIPEGTNKIPSVVAFLENDEMVVGEIARRQAVSNSINTIFSIKRILGHRYSDLVDLGELDFIPYKIVNQDDSVLINIRGKLYRPEQIAAQILLKLKKSAEEYLESEVEQAIISVPAYFDGLQREATLESARLAGLKVLRLINEPTAAAMAYGLGKSSEEIVVVYDFGGGTFDITILEIDNNTFEVIHSTGDSHLGGDDLDNAIVEKIVEDFYEKYEIDLSKDPTTLWRLKEAAEKAKCELSMSLHSVINLPFITQKNGQPLHLDLTIKRSELEALIQEFVDRTIACCKQAMGESGLSLRDIAKVILVGGSTRIPLVKECVEEFFEQEPFRGVNPDEIVALGAATQAGVLEGSLQEVVLLDVTPHSLGIEVKDNKFSYIIEKNSTIPIKAAKTFTTTENHQTFVNIHILQGESKIASENKSLGKFILSGINPVLAGVPRIRVTFFINADGVLDISASDLQSGAEKSLRIVHTFLSEDEQRSRKKKRRKRKIATHFERIKSAKRIEEAVEPIPFSDVTDKAAKVGTDTTQMKVKFKVLDDSQVEYVEPSAGVSSAPEGEKEALAVVESPQNFSEMPTEQILTKQSDSTPLITHPSLADEKEKLYIDSAKTQSLPKESLPLPEILFQDGEYSDIDIKKSASVCEKVVPEIVKWLNIYPQDSIYNIYLSKCYIFLNHPEKAFAYLKKYQISEGSDSRKVLSALNLFIQVFPDYPIARNERANVAKDIGEFKIAMEDCEYLCEIQEESEGVEDNLIDIYQEILKGGFDPNIQLKLIKIYVKRNLFDEAIELLQDLIKDKAYEERAVKILGFCYWQKNMHILAWQQFRLLPINEETKDILYRLAEDMELSDQLDEAKEVYEYIFKNAPNYLDVDAKIKKIQYRKNLQQEELIKAMPNVLVDDPRFIILEEINRGSMGIIYKARDKTLDEIVALKVLNDYLTLDPKAIERFKREARAAKKLSHPNIVRIHDMFESGDKKYISMEYIQGIDLKKILSKTKKLTLKEIYVILRQICDALSYAHKINIIHRDIKPANIMITPDNIVKITDFGIAKILKGDDATKSGTNIIGTPLYMSPEQIIGDDIDSRSDIYSFGITMYEIATGNPPFCQGNIEYHHIHTPCPPLPDDTDNVLKTIIERCLKKKPEDRFQSVDEIRALIE